MRHQLALEVPSVNNIKILRIEDFSVWNENIPKECVRLEVTVPGFVQASVVEVAPGFTSNLTSCELGLQSTGCDENTYTLPDGIYVIRLSAAPNDKVYVEYNHLRMSQTWNRYMTELCKLELRGQEPDVELKAKIRELQMIRAFLEAAKGKVEIEHEPHRGMELFLYAQKLLSQVVSCSKKC